MKLQSMASPRRRQDCGLGMQAVRQGGCAARQPDVVVIRPSRPPTRKFSCQDTTAARASISTQAIVAKVPLA